jgi:hypothetical protein
MRKLIFFACLCFLAYNICSEPVLNKVLNHDKDKLEVIFTNNLSKADLGKIKTDLKAKGIDITYNHTSFNYRGKLSGITFSVDCNDGFTGQSSTKHLIFNRQVGFRRDYNLLAAESFVIGSI